MVAKLADGMAAAHQKGVVHRDLKPANVLLTDTGEPKITDFGLAKIGQSDMTATGAVMGTPSYMSPEQAAGKTREIGTPTDVYALGAILYELTTGGRPFKGDTAMETIQQVLTQEPKRPRLIDPKIPRDLETICLKCLDKDAKKRYGTAAELAAELRTFLDGRPILARPVRVLERTWKWAKRNPGWTAGIAASFLLLVAATISGLVIREQVIEEQNSTRAAEMVKAVLNADTAKVPEIVDGMAAYRQWTDPKLREENDKAEAKSRQKLHASLALLPVDPGQVDYLYERLLEAQPQEVPVIVDALAPHKDGLRDKLWAVAETPEKVKEPKRLRAACALAKYDPENAKWGNVQKAVGNDLVAEPALYVSAWMKSLGPVKGRLLDPLSEIFGDTKSGEVARSLATDILADYAADNPPKLADLLMDADDKQFAVIFPKFKEQGENGLPVLISVIDTKLSADLTSSDVKRETLAKRQANAAVALLRMNRPEKVWPLLKHSPDPRVRSYLIHRLSPLGADATAIVKQWDVEPDLTIRRALLLSMGEFGDEALPVAARTAVLPKVQAIYRTDADPGLHAASEWLLRTWKQEAWLKQVNEEWAKASRAASAPGFFPAIKDKNPVAHTPGSPKAPQWYVNTQGQTYVVVPGPMEFVMGSPKSEKDRSTDEVQHKRRIGRSFAIASKSVTLAEYRKLTGDKYEIGEKYTYDPNLPVVGINWYMAAKYCNLLSKEEGLEECYEIKGTSPDYKGTLLKENYLSLNVYRLPTEAEMEFATRAGAATSRYYGETEELLGHYAWYTKSSNDVLMPVGRKKPNDLGLFDVQGNCYAWCQKAYEEYPTASGDAVVEDKEGELVINSTGFRVLRGGSFNALASYVRSASRYTLVPTLRGYNFGFRLSRTFTP